MESIYCNGNQESKRLSASKPCEFITDHDYYFLITPTQLFVTNDNNKPFDASKSINDLHYDFSRVREAAWNDDQNKYSLTNNDLEFLKNLATIIPPIGRPEENLWIGLAVEFCKNFCFPGANQPKDSIVMGYWDEIEYFSKRARNIKQHISQVSDEDISQVSVAERLNFYRSITATVEHLPGEMRDFCYTGDTYIEDALYPPFDISMAVRLNTVKVENDSPSFLSGLKELQKQLGQETIAIFEIGRSIVKLHILNLLSQPPTHTKAAMRIYHIINTATKQTSNPHAAIIDSIITGRCFAHQLLSTRPTSNCVVPYATHIPPLIKRAQAYHNHLSDTTNKDRGIGSTWLPGGILAVAEGRWVWDIAFPFNNQSEHQNSLIRIDESKQLHLLSSTTSGQPLEIEPAPGRNTLQPPLCQDPDQAIAAQNWSTLLGGL